MNAAVTFRDMDVTAEPTGTVPAARHRSVYTFLAGQAVSYNEILVNRILPNANPAQ
ncbi:hypothetical protein FM038_25325 [Shewanella eurypsychrophilus]|uniref:Uncharacterized protein n=1 Tax=Shewanella eurypsychrophilus TaxID=2593656 RepID=A0ABX8S394_9GAMM|nr:hypothetical protein [Shewanella eurypsychrophilus]QXP45022.1 hypothetical protein FM038_25325 [Shewanella eurypsychrophilus]